MACSIIVVIIVIVTIKHIVTEEKVHCCMAPDPSPVSVCSDQVKSFHFCISGTLYEVKPCHTLLEFAEYESEDVLRQCFHDLIQDEVCKKHSLNVQFHVLVKCNF